MTFNYQHIMQVLTSRSSVIDYTGEDERIKKLAALAAVRSGSVNNWTKHENIELPVLNGLAKAPKDMLRLLRVRGKNRQRIVYGLDNNRHYIKPQHIIKGKIFIDYYGLSSDEDGFPPIYQEQIDYVVAHIELNFIKDLWLMGKVDNSKMQYFEEKERQAFNVSQNDNISVDEMEAAIWLMRNARHYNPDIIL